MNTSNRTTPDCISRLLDEASHAKVGDSIRSDKIIMHDGKRPDFTINAYGNEICVRSRAISRLSLAGFVQIVSQNAEFITAIWAIAPNRDAMELINADDEKPHPYIVTVWQTVQRQILVYGKSIEDVYEDVSRQVKNGKISKLDRSDDLHADIKIGCPFRASDGAAARMFKQNLIARDPDGTLHDTNDEKERFV